MNRVVSGLEHLAELSISNIPILAERSSAYRTQLPNPGSFPLFNPSIVRAGDGGFLCIARSSSLCMFSEKTYKYEKKPHATTNYLFQLDRDLNFVSSEILDDSSVRTKNSLAEAGIEDCRLFVYQGDIWAIGAATPLMNGEYGKTRQILFKIENNGISEFHYGPYPFKRMEKNWTPVESDDFPITALYDLTSGTKVVLDEGGFSFPSEEPKEGGKFSIRGGTPLVKFGSHYISLAHSAPIKANDRLHYLHHFVIYDKLLRHVETSPPFFLRRRGIEFACGLQIIGDVAYIAYGVADRAAEIMRIPTSSFKDLLVMDSY